MQLVAPGSEAIDPSLDLVLPVADRVDLELAGPAHAVHLRVDALERCLAPAIGLGLAASPTAVAHSRP